MAFQCGLFIPLFSSHDVLSFIGTNSRTVDICGEAVLGLPALGRFENEFLFFQSDPWTGLPLKHFNRTPKDKDNLFKSKLPPARFLLVQFC